MDENANLLTTKSFINNEWVGKNTERYFYVNHRYDNNSIARIIYADSEEVERAISSSVDAFKIFKKSTILERRNYLEKIKDAIHIERDKFINLIVSEAGKPIDYASAEIDRAIALIDACIHEMMVDVGEVVPMNYPPAIGKTALTKKHPIGPILAISPFNFPLNLALHKIIPAIATGNTIILKPSLDTPLTALAFASLCKKIGLPAGVLNIVICENFEAEKMVTDDRIKMLSFTGSAEVGWKLKTLAGKKKVTLELGGNAAAIVDRSCQLEEVAKSLCNGAFLYAGQICISTQRIYVDDQVFDQFIELFVSFTKNLKIGSPHESGIMLGPVINEHHLYRIHKWVTEALDLGASIILGGEIIDQKHHIYAPTIITNAKPGMRVLDEEIFGPVVIIERVQFFDEVIKEINRSRFGLQASLFSNQLSQIKYAEEHLEVGALIINSIPGFRIDSMPYGGVKDSGLGREGVRYTMDEMRESRLLVY